MSWTGAHNEFAVKMGFFKNGESLIAKQSFPYSFQVMLE